MRIREQTVDELWAEYSRTRSDEVRNAIAERHLHTVEVIAKKLFRRCPETVDIDDLLSWGTMGLMQAVARYDATQGVKFTTFAATRVRGEMLDQMRAHSRLPRLTQRRVDQIESYRDQYRMAFGREATREEVVEQYGERAAQSVDEVREQRSIHAVIGTDSSGRPQPAAIALEDRREVDPTIYAQGRDLMEYAIQNFKLSEALMMKCYFWEGLTMAEIGKEVLSKSESRVSQMMTSVLTRLREAA